MQKSQAKRFEFQLTIAFAMLGANDARKVARHAAAVMMIPLIRS
jgi:hypothetical protein